MERLRNGFINGNMLKWIAILTMTVDHCGYYLCGNATWMRVIGRIAFPIFAFLLAEGFYYTKDRKKYFLSLLAFAALSQGVFIFFGDGWRCNIFITFCFSFGILYLYKRMIKHLCLWTALLFVGYMVLVSVICFVLPKHIPGFSIMYGFFGALLPCIAYCSRESKSLQLVLFGAGLLLVSLFSGNLQVYAILALIPIAFYDGTRKAYTGMLSFLNWKYLFYIYYPAHLCFLMALAKLL